ncbi:hypothetical protein FWH13_03655 [Candidatus Saccharibacteria bacterium]|nr:hypothetical protein [Candidatus Saccharibacteria bacterium]
MLNPNGGGAPTVDMKTAGGGDVTGTDWDALAVEERESGQDKAGTAYQKLQEAALAWKEIQGKPSSDYHASEWQAKKSAFEEAAKQMQEVQPDFNLDKTLAQWGMAGEAAPATVAAETQETAAQETATEPPIAAAEAPAVEAPASEIQSAPSAENQELSQLEAEVLAKEAALRDLENKLKGVPHDRVSDQHMERLTVEWQDARRNLAERKAQIEEEKKLEQVTDAYQEMVDAMDRIMGAAAMSRSGGPGADFQRWIKAGNDFEESMKKLQALGVEEIHGLPMTREAWAKAHNLDFYDSIGSNRDDKLAAERREAEAKIEEVRARLLGATSDAKDLRARMRENPTGDWEGDKGRVAGAYEQAMKDMMAADSQFDAQKWFRDNWGDGTNKEVDRIALQEQTDEAMRKIDEFVAEEDEANEALRQMAAKLKEQTDALRGERDARAELERNKERAKTLTKEILALEMKLAAMREDKTPEGKRQRGALYKLRNEKLAELRKLAPSFNDAAYQALKKKALEGAAARGESAGEDEPAEEDFGFKNNLIVTEAKSKLATDAYHEASDQIRAEIETGKDADGKKVGRVKRFLMGVFRETYKKKRAALIARESDRKLGEDTDEGAAWREEMLDEVLSQFVDKKTGEEVREMERGLDSELHNLVRGVATGVIQGEELQERLNRYRDDGQLDNIQQIINEAVSIYERAVEVHGHGRALAILDRSMNQIAVARSDRGEAGTARERKHWARVDSIYDRVESGNPVASAMDRPVMKESEMLARMERQMDQLEEIRKNPDALFMFNRGGESRARTTLLMVRARMGSSHERDLIDYDDDAMGNRLGNTADELGNMLAEVEMLAEAERGYRTANRRLAEEGSGRRMSRDRFFQIWQERFDEPAEEDEEASILDALGSRRRDKAGEVSFWNAFEDELDKYEGRFLRRVDMQNRGRVNEAEPTAAEELRPRPAQFEHIEATSEPVELADGNASAYVAPEDAGRAAIEAEELPVAERLGDVSDELESRMNAIMEQNRAQGKRIEDLEQLLRALATNEEVPDNIRQLLTSSGLDLPLAA